MTLGARDPLDSAPVRKARGAFFSPPKIAAFVTDWAVRTPHDAVLEPSAGDAEFLVLLADLNDTAPSIRAFEANDLTTEVPLAEAFDTLVALIGERNFDLYEGLDGHVSKA